MFEDCDLKAAEFKIAHDLFGSSEIVGNIVRRQPWYRDLAHKLAKSFYQARIELSESLLTLQRG